MSTVQAMRDEGRKPSPWLALSVRFRNGETLTREQLALLRDYAVANGNEILAARCRLELSTEEASR